MTGRDTKAHLTGFFVGLVGIAIVVLSLVYLTNKKFEGHGEQAAATSTQH
ncbi:MAG: hypothetical protein KF689_12135 [Gemmatimonadaceae bacterium]|nr:hypothetical protein [Gemmatimonadaceae bacterium]MCW5827271.1 hypothetical protein [Gemmatimonadaceae bacterium]